MSAPEHQCPPPLHPTCCVGMWAQGVASFASLLTDAEACSRLPYNFLQPISHISMGTTGAAPTPQWLQLGTQVCPSPRSCDEDSQHMGMAEGGPVLSTAPHRTCRAHVLAWSSESVNKIQGTNRCEEAPSNIRGCQGKGGASFPELSEATKTKCHRLGGFKQQTFSLSKLWRAEVQDQGVSRAVILPEVLGEGPSCVFQFPRAPGFPWLMAASLQSPLLSSHGLPVSVSQIPLFVGDH